MTKVQIEEIKTKGSKESLLNALHNKLWNIKTASEKAASDCFKDFTKEAINIKKALEDAQQLFEEASKI